MLSTRQDIYLIFKKIDEGDHFEKVLFYEQNKEDIAQMENDQQVFLRYYYIHSLFEIGKYQKVLIHIDQSIEDVFFDHKLFTCISAFENLLFIKARCLHRMLKFSESKKILEELVGIQPFELSFSDYLLRVYFDELQFRSSGIKVSAVILIFLSSIACGAFWILTDGSAGQPRTGMFLGFMAPAILAIVLLITNFFFNKFISLSRVKGILRKKRRKLFK